jgi:hypothetical protein
MVAGSRTEPVNWSFVGAITVYIALVDEICDRMPLLPDRKMANLKDRNFEGFAASAWKMVRLEFGTFGMFTSFTSCTMLLTPLVVTVVPSDDPRISMFSTKTVPDGVL